MIDPAKLLAPASSVWSSVSTNMAKKLQKAMEAYDSYKQARKTHLTVVHMDFPVYIKHDFMLPEETIRQMELYVVFIEQLRDAAEEILAKLIRLKEVNQDDNDLVEATVFNDNIHIPDAVGSHTENQLI